MIITQANLAIPCPAGSLSDIYGYHAACRSSYAVLVVGAEWYQGQGSPYPLASLSPHGHGPLTVPHQHPLVARRTAYPNVRGLRQ